METIALIFPTKEYETQVMEYKREFEINGACSSIYIFSNQAG